MTLSQSADNSASNSFMAGGGPNEGSTLHRLGLGDDDSRMDMFSAGIVQFVVAAGRTYRV